MVAAQAGQRAPTATHRAIQAPIFSFPPIASINTGTRPKKTGCADVNSTRCSASGISIPLGLGQLLEVDEYSGRAEDRPHRDRLIKERPSVPDPSKPGAGDYQYNYDHFQDNVQRYARPMELITQRPSDDWRFRESGCYEMKSTADYQKQERGPGPTYMDRGPNAA